MSDQVIEGIDAARRAGWAKYYAAREELAQAQVAAQDAYWLGRADASAAHEAALSYDEAFNHGYRVGYGDATRSTR